MIQKSCNVCSGVCTKQKQCVYTPSDLGESFATLLNRYQDGRLAIQCICDEKGNVQGLLPRLPYENLPGVILYTGTDNAKCKFWNGRNCTLEKQYLPKYMDDENYILKAYVQWMPYMENLLEEMAEHILAVERKEDEKYFDHLQCKICAGQCCKNNGCSFSPSDFKRISFPILKKIIEKGFIAIIEVDKFVTGFEKDILALRVRNKDEPVVNLSGEHNEGCILLEDTGCPFSDDDRPYGGRALIPEKFILGTCIRGCSSRQIAEAWFPYQEILQALKDEFEGKYIEYTGIC